MNERIYKYLAPKKVEVTLPDGRRQVTTAVYKSTTTPGGLPVRSEYWRNTLTTGGTFVMFVGDKRYDGPVIVTCGPETETQILPRSKPYVPGSGNPGGH